uniref:dynamin family protein n=1 Tax=Candidatus Cryptobacteroides bacterium TaxID=3085639 RepID=UPI0040257AD1
MNNETELHSSDFQRLSFIKAFQSLLDERIESESEEIRKTKLECEMLKIEIRDILEKIKALDILNDDFSVIDICEHNVDLPLRRYVEQCKKPWLQDKLTIALMGHLKTGKTSAMNCYFGEDFPTSSEEATALATYLYDGDNPKQTALLVDKEGSVQEINAEQLQLFSLENSFNFPFARMFSYIAKKSKHPALSDKTFIDTPGLFSSNSEHAYTTYKVLDYSDVVFWFVDCRKSISITEIAFIKDQIGNKPIYIIFSFVDGRGTTESGIKKAQDVIKQKLSEEGVTIQGYLQFGRKESTQEQFRKDFGKIIELLGNNYQTIDPISQIIQFLLVLQEKIVLSAQKELTERKNKKKKELDELSNNISAATRSVQSAFSSVDNRFSDMINTLNNRCANVTFCTGGAYNTLLSNVNQLASSLQTIAEAWGNVDYDVIVQFGALSANIGRLEDIISRLDSINTDINKILNKFKS